MLRSGGRPVGLQPDGLITTLPGITSDEEGLAPTSPPNRGSTRGSRTWTPVTPTCQTACMTIHTEDHASDDERRYAAKDVEVARERLRALTNGFPEISERLSHGSTTFFIRNKRVLCYLSDDHHGDGRLALICAAPPGVQEELTTSDPERFFRPPYVGHRGWIGPRLDIAPDWDEVASLLDEAYRQVAPVTLVRAWDASRG